MKTYYNCNSTGYTWRCDRDLNNIAEPHPLWEWQEEAIKGKNLMHLFVERKCVWNLSQGESEGQGNKLSVQRLFSVPPWRQAELIKMQQGPFISAPLACRIPLQSHLFWPFSLQTCLFIQHHSQSESSQLAWCMTASHPPLEEMGFRNDLICATQITLWTLGHRSSFETSQCVHQRTHNGMANLAVLFRW